MGEQTCLVSLTVDGALIIIKVFIVLIVIIHAYKYNNALNETYLCDNYIVNLFYRVIL